MKRSLLTTAGAVFAATATLLLFMNCTSKPPEILQLFHKVTLIEDLEQNHSYFALSLFVHATDADGFEDLEEIYLISDAEELFWKIDSDSWVESGSGDEIWIGSNEIRMPGGSPLPEGEYRVLLKDVGGDSDERTIYIPGMPARASRLIPKVQIKEGEIRVTGAADAYTLWISKPNGQFVRTWPLEGHSLSVQEIMRQDGSLRAGFALTVYAEFPDGELGVRTGPYAIRP